MNNLSGGIHTKQGWVFILIRVLCENVAEINGLIELIKEKYAIDYRRTWSLEDREIGVFLYEHLGILAGNTFTIMTIVDFDKLSGTCEVSVRYVGGAMSLIGIGRSENFITTMINEISRFADEKGWIYEVKKIKVKPAGSPCPHCGATYKYPKEKRREDGSVDCQNCGKSFSPN